MPRTIFSVNRRRLSTGIGTPSPSVAGRPHRSPKPGYTADLGIRGPSRNWLPSRLARAVRASLSRPLLPCSGLSDLSAFLAIEAVSAAWGSRHKPNRVSRSPSNAPYSLLQGRQLGICHLWRFGGVVSGYHARGNTWSHVRSTSGFRQWTHLPRE